MPELYFTKFESGEKHVLTEIGWAHANEPEVLKVRPIAAYQLRQVTHEEWIKIMTLPLDWVMQKHFPNI